MTKIDTSKEAVERLLDGVTPGPWAVRFAYDEDRVVIDGTGFPVAYDVASADRRFIAAARDLVPALSAALEAEKSRADAAEAELSALRAGQDALVAAACMSMRDQCADMVEREGHGLHVAIRHAPIPSDATAALDARLQAERNKALREAIAGFYAQAANRTLFTAREIEIAILAMIEKDQTNDR